MASRASKFDDLLILLGTEKWNIFTMVVASYLTMNVPYHIVAGAFLTPAVTHTCVLPSDAHPLFVNTTNGTVQSQCAYLVEGVDGELEEQPCTSWDFDNSTYSSTLTSEFQMVCDRRYLRPIFSSVYHLGALFGSPLTGWLSDRYGRKKIASVSASVFVVLGSVLAWLPNMTSVLAVRCVMGIVQPAAVQSVFTLVMEVFQPRHRTTVGIIIFLPWCLGTMVFGGVAYLIRDWRRLIFTVSLPGFLIFPGLWLIDESPRWLIVKGQHDRALRVLEKAASWNKVTLPPQLFLMDAMNTIRQETMQHRDNNKIREENFSFLRRIARELSVLVRTKTLRRITLSLYTVYLCIPVVYTGLSLSGDGLGSDPFVYMVMSGVMEIPGATLTIPIAQRFGRRNSNILICFFTGIILLSLTFIPSEMNWLVTSLALVSKLTVSAAYQILYLHTSELFPTEVRNRGMGTTIMASKVGDILAPFIVDTLRDIWVTAPTVVFSVASLVAVGTTFLLPETGGAALHDTVTQLEAATNPRH